LGNAIQNQDQLAELYNYFSSSATAVNDSPGCQSGAGNLRPVVDDPVAIVQS